ncbi:MAG TPA: hypothetical protein VFQ47_02995 [Nitrososphaera sp.]|nr:hypothetical protein [Nitrososphaera sp.]
MNDQAIVMVVNGGLGMVHLRCGKLDLMSFVSRSSMVCTPTVTSPTTIRKLRHGTPKASAH